jgi:DNA-binding transcriptional ArsR family regulator
MDCDFGDIPPVEAMAYAALLQGLASPSRRQVMRLLKRREGISAGEVASELSLPLARAEYHLRELILANAIETRWADGVQAPTRTRLFRVIPPVLRMEWVLCLLDETEPLDTAHGTRRLISISTRTGLSS